MRASRIITIIIGILWVFSCAWIDAEHLNNAQYFSDHSSRLVMRATVVAMLVVLDWKVGVIVASLFWLLFDAILNVMRGLPILYRGTEAVSDTLLSNTTLYIITKLLALAVAIFLTIKIIKR